MNKISKKIAVVGYAFRFPGDMEDEASFWEALCTQTDLVTEVDASRWGVHEFVHPQRTEPGRSITFAAGVLSRVDEFDAEFFGISPREAAWIDPQQRLLLELTWRATEHAGIPASSLAGSRTSVFVGISSSDYATGAADDLAAIGSHTMTGIATSIAANRISYVFDLHGPSLCIDTACSSSLVALHHACNSLLLEEAETAIVGGVNMLLHPYPFVGFSKASMLSAKGRCQTFDAQGDGYVRSEGGAVLLLKPLEKAQADGDTIHAVILASGVNTDGARKSGLTIPSSEGQVELMQEVLARSGLQPSDVVYLEAHGTGTAVGDPVETAAIGAVYGQGRGSEPLPIGSVKTNVGHLEPASGMAGLIKALLVLRYRQVPPSLHLNTLNPQIDFAALNLLPVQTLHALESSGQPCVGVNSFGFGGANAHVLLQAAPQPSAPCLPVGSELKAPLVISARSLSSLQRLAADYAECLIEVGPDARYAVAHAAAFRREWMSHRLGLPAENVSGWIESLRSISRGEAVDGAVQLQTEVTQGCFGFVYSGNGAQWIGMGCQLLDESPRFAALLAEVDVYFKPLGGFSLLDALRAPSSTSRMAETEVAQPLLFAIQYGLTHLLMEAGIKPAAVTGHSVGEVAAAWAAGALTLPEAIRVIVARSEAQAQTRGLGRMAAVSTNLAGLMDVTRALQLEGAVEIASYNSPTNLTISSSLETLQQLAVAFRARGVAFRILDLDYAFHSHYMDPIAQDLEARLVDFLPQRCVGEMFVSTVAGGAMPQDTRLDTQYWWRNVRQPVRFAGAVQHMARMGCQVFVELGPHPILMRYIRESLDAVGHFAHVLPALNKKEGGFAHLQGLLLKLQVLGGANTLREVFPQTSLPCALPYYPWDREVYPRPKSNEAYAVVSRQRMHPLLGWALKDADHAWENVLDVRTLSWLQDHQVGGACVFPGAAYMEMALAAGRLWLKAVAVELEEFDISAPMVLEADHGRTVQLHLNGRDGSFQIRSRQRLSTDGWTLHAQGRVCQLEGSCALDDGIQIPAEPRPKLLEGPPHYDMAASLGLAYGPSFQGLRACWIGAQTLEAQLTSPALLEFDAYGVHPALLDCAFQAVLGFFDEALAQGFARALLPVKCARLRSWRAGVIHSIRMVLRSRSLRSVCVDIVFMDVSGQVLGSIVGMRFRAAWFRPDRSYSACWETVALLKPGVKPSQHAPQKTLEQLYEVWLKHIAQPDTDAKLRVYYDQILPLCDALVLALAHESGAQMLAHPMYGMAPEDPDVLPEALRPLLAWLMGCLQQESLLTRGGEGEWHLLPSKLPSAREIWQLILKDFPQTLPELLPAGRLLLQLPRMLAGKAPVDVLQQLMVQAGAASSRLLDAAGYAEQQDMYVSILRPLLDDPTRMLRVLDVGGGTWELPRQLVTLAGERLHYVLATLPGDSSVQLAQDYRGLTGVSVLGLDEVCQADGNFLLPDFYDVLILHHSLHRLDDPGKVMASLRKRLAHGGLLILAERHPDWLADLLDGLACGWLRDAQGRPWSRLRAPSAWQEFLQDCGFEQIQACVWNAVARGPYLLLARGHGALPVLPMSTLPTGVLTLEAKDDAASLAEGLRERGVPVVPLGELPVGAEACSALLAQHVQLEQLILLVAPDKGDTPSMVPCLRALALFQALKSHPRPLRVWMLLPGGAPVAGYAGQVVSSPALAALWGLGRVAMNELQSLDCRMIDLRAPLQDAALRAMVMDEICHPDLETELMLGVFGRRALRIRPTRLQTPSQRGEALGYRLDFLVPGQLRNLEWMRFTRPPLAAHEVEVQPHAAGLNFRDIMYVLGLLPDEAVEKGFAGPSLGLEMAGIVTRVGSAVHRFAVGDAVMGFAPSCFASHVITREDALSVKPQEWSFEAAATVPTVFLTVYYALHELARLRAGERVLIHGAAGGVGIAAVQLARALGAEVFATAGNDEKRDFVRLLGADHVFDSRSLTFADEILLQTQGEGVDVVLNSLAGEAIRRNLRILRPFGRFIELGKRDFFENTSLGLRPFKDNISYFGVDADQLLMGRAALASALFDEVMALFAEGRLHPLPWVAFEPARVVEAFRHMQQARHIGKVVVRFNPHQNLAALSRNEHRGPQRFQPEGSYLVTGGLTGFGLETACAIAAQGAGEVVLLSRRGEATPGAAEARARIAAAGAQVRIFACDVCDVDALADVLKQIPALRGVFHAAMVLDDGYIGQLDSERFGRVLAPKLLGAWNLHVLTQQPGLDHFVLYSSVTNLMGNPGQANYVAANMALDALACLRADLGLPVSCVGWGPVADAGYLVDHSVVMDALVRVLGAPALKADDGLAALMVRLQDVRPNLVLADFRWSSLQRFLHASDQLRFELLMSEQGDEPENNETEDFCTWAQGRSEGEIRAQVMRGVVQELAQIMGVAIERVDPARPLHDMGLDSLMGMELALALENRFAVKVPSMVLNEGPSVQRIAARIMEALSVMSDDSEGVADGRVSIAEDLARRHGEAVTAEVLELVQTPDHLKPERNSK